MNALVDFDNRLDRRVPAPPSAAGHHAAAHRLRLRRREREVPDPFTTVRCWPEFGSSFSLPARIGPYPRPRVILLGLPYRPRARLTVGFAKPEFRIPIKPLRDRHGNGA